jgi:hypothetical protein
VSADAVAPAWLRVQRHRTPAKQMVPSADAQVSVSGLGAAAEDKAIRPFHINIPDEALVDLRRRLAATRWPDKRSEPDSGRFAS